MGSLTPGGDSCLCLSNIPHLITTNVVAEAAAVFVGQATTINAVATLVVSGFNNSLSGLVDYPTELNFEVQYTYPHSSLAQCLPNNPRS